MLRPQAATAGRGCRLWIGLDDRLLMRHGIVPHIPLLDREHQTKASSSEPTFDPRANVLVCPAGKQLRSGGMVREDGTAPYWASTKDCRACRVAPKVQSKLSPQHFRG